MSPRAEQHATEFDHIYRDHVGFVWRSLRSLGVPEEAVEDATHEVFVVVHRRLADWDRQTKITTWLYGIARGVSRNARRAARRRDRKHQAIRVVDPPATDDSPERRVATAQAAAILERFLETLDPRYRLVFELCEVEGVAPIEAARALEANPNSVSTRLRRARQQFARFVAEHNARTA